MKTLKKLLCLSPLALFLAGCAAPVHKDTTISQWEREGLLPPTGSETSRVYAQPAVANYPAHVPNIVVEQADQRNTGPDRALAESIRDQFEYDRGLAPSLTHVTISVQNGQVFLLGSVKSDMDVRLVVDGLRDIPGIVHISNQLEINPDADNML